MYKKILFIFFFLFFNHIAIAELKVGFVQVDIILKDAPQATQSNKTLEKEFKTRTEKLKKEINNLNDQEGKLKKEGLTLSSQDKEKQEKKLQQTRIDIQRAERELREDIDLRRREEINKLQAKVTEVIEKLAKEQKFDLILYSSVAFASDKVNITNDVLKALAENK